MANQDHLKRLRQGVPAWNQWRKEHPDIQPDLSRANLSFADLSHADLSAATLSFANLIGAILSQATLNWANLSAATLSGADLSWANLSEAVRREVA